MAHFKVTWIQVYRKNSNVGFECFRTCFRQVCCHLKAEIAHYTDSSSAAVTCCHFQHRTHSAFHTQLGPWSCSITCESVAFYTSWSRISEHGRTRHSTLLCNTGRCTVELEPPPCSCGTGHCTPGLPWKGEIHQLSMKKGEEKQNLNKISLFFMRWWTYLSRRDKAACCILLGFWGSNLDRRARSAWCRRWDSEPRARGSLRCRSANTEERKDNQWPNHDLPETDLFTLCEQQHTCLKGPLHFFVVV